MTDLARPSRQPVDPAHPAPAPAGAAAGPPPALRILFAGLVLYVAFGKGFAYAGYPPVFVGEVLLLVVVLAAWRPDAAIPRNGAALLTLGLAALAVVQVADDLVVGDAARLEIARGVAPITYAAFAFGLYALLRRWEEGAGAGAVLDAVEAAVVRVTPFVVGGLAILASLLVVNVTSLPLWPGSGVPMLLTKATDISVGLVLVGPIVLRPDPRWPSALPRRVVLALWCAATLLVVFRSRGALGALLIGLVVARPRPERALRVVLAGTVLLFVLYATGLSVRAGDREVSFRSATEAVSSVVGAGATDAPGQNFVGTRKFRTQWWGAIWSDAVHQPMILHGHGWGDNLNVRYHGIQVGSGEDPPALRLPHNIFFSLAGRAGLVTAVGFLLVPFITVLRAFTRAGPRPGSRLVEGARGAVVAGVVVGLTDVYLESPQGAILLWSLIGFLWWTTAARAPEEAAGA